MHYTINYYIFSEYLYRINRQTEINNNYSAKLIME